ncbi:MAG: carboxylating nicotinate-nucleotide diphosphorylase [Candidatus Eremiobacteraeota bacterium]|nr:carboxylating nicotinate-nucleotide diphosphorylase [Candidatus Eremiobacteraeota bacterium]
MRKQPLHDVRSQRLHASLEAPHRLLIEPVVKTALLEDIGRGQDITTDAIVPADRVADAVIVSRADGVVAGTDAATLAFAMLDPAARVDVRIRDGERVRAGETAARVHCTARALLTAERTALNILCRLSGIATATRELVDAIDKYHAKIVCTRKTTPGLRVLEKYAVRCGGGSNHRFGLDDAVLVKDNHIAIAGSLHAAVQAVRAACGHMVRVEVEVDTLDQLREVLELGVDAILLDNMSPDQLAQAVAIVDHRAVTEASGRVRRETVVPIAASGVDLISVGWLTHSAPALDLGLDVSL